MRQNRVFGSKWYLLVLFVLAGVSAAPLAATEIYWIADTGGLFNDPYNWDPCNVPGADDIAIFSLGSAYDLTFNDSVTNTQCIFRNDTINVDLGACTYTLAVTNDHALIVGDGSGDVAEITMANGVIDAFNLKIALWGESTGVLTLNDGMEVNVTDILVVGNDGDGTLNVNSGAVVHSDYVQIGGHYTGNQGYLNVSGDTAELHVTNGLCVGYDGIGNMSISNDGYVYAGDLQVGMNASGLLSSVQVDGADSELEVAHELKVGIWSMGDLAVSGGATVRTTDNNGWIYFGDAPGSYGQCTVSGTDSLLDAEAAPIVVGNEGEGYLTIENEGHAHTGGELIVGRLEDSYGETWITGFGSRFISDGLYSSVVGESGQGWLTIDNEGYAQMPGLDVGRNENSEGRVELYGSGSELQMNGSYRVGCAGNGYLWVSDGASVTAGEMVAGCEATGYAEMIIIGSDSSLEIINNDAVIGDAGYAEMEIGNGASVTVNQNMIVSRQNGSYGQVQIIGDTDSYYPLSDGIQPTFTTSGARLTSAGGVLGHDENSEGWVELWGTDSASATWTVGVDYIGSDLIVGREGFGALNIGEYSEVLVRDRPMNPQDPSYHGSPWVFVGGDATGQGYITIDGEQANMTIENSPMTVGYNGYGELSIQNGGSLTMGNGELWVGKYNGSFGNVTVSGTGSRLEEYSDYDSVIGGEGRGEMYVFDGSYANIRNLTIGQEIGGVGNVIVAGGSVLEIGDYLTVGRYGDGALDLNSTEYGSPGYMTLGGADLMDVMPGELHIGEYGTLKGNGTLCGDVINLAGYVEPGASVGLLTINGDYIQDSGGVLYLDIAGDGQGEYDVLQVNGDVHLEGHLGLWVVDGFLPQQGMTFDIIRFSGEIDPSFGWFSGAWWNFVPEGYPDWHYDLSLVSLDADTWAIRATSLNSVPEPATMFLLAVGAVALRSRRKKS